MGERVWDVQRLIDMIEKYFTLSNYYTIDGKPVFMIFSLPTFISGLGGLEHHFFGFSRKA